MLSSVVIWEFLEKQLKVWSEKQNYIFHHEFYYNLCQIDRGIKDPELSFCAKYHAASNKTLKRRHAI